MNPKLDLELFHRTPALPPPHAQIPRDNASRRGPTPGKVPSFPACDCALAQLGVALAGIYTQKFLLGEHSLGTSGWLPAVVVASGFFVAHS